MGEYRRRPGIDGLAGLWRAIQMLDMSVLKSGTAAVVFEAGDLQRLPSILLTFVPGVMGVGEAVGCI